MHNSGTRVDKRNREAVAGFTQLWQTLCQVSRCIPVFSSSFGCAAFPYYGPRFGFLPRLGYYEQHCSEYGNAGVSSRSQLSLGGGAHPEVRSLDHMGILLLIFGRSSVPFPIVSAFPPEAQRGSGFSPSSPTLTMSSLFFFF